MIKFNLPIWLNKGEVIKLQEACFSFFERLEKWLNYTQDELDPLFCDERFLYLLAYERDITRLPGETLELFRKRIKYAFINAQEAGDVKGFYNIFKRLDIELKLLSERQNGYDWDVIVLRFKDSVFTQNDELLYEIVRKYGRTCKRYFFEIVHVADNLKFKAGHFTNTTNINGCAFDFHLNYRMKQQCKTGSFREIKHY